MNEQVKPEETLVPASSANAAPVSSEEAVSAPVPETADALRLTQQEIDALRARLEEAEKRNTEYLKARQEAEAAFASYRRRIEAEKADWSWQANARLLATLLPILDDFERAYQTLPQGLQTLSWTSGLWLIRRKLEWVLETEGVKPITVTPGQAFDPYLHEAALRETHATIPEGHIVSEIQRGYIWNDRVVLRPALVSVATGAADAPAPTETPAPAENPDANSGEETA